MSPPGRPEGEFRSAQHEGPPVSGPLPVLAARHWAAAAAHELRVPHCLSCAHLWYPPSRHCPRCLSSESDWQAVSGRGRVLGATVFHRAYFPERRVPYVVLLVQLDEGPQLYTNPAGPERLMPIGQRVRAVFVPVGEGEALVRFEPVEEA